MDGISLPPDLEQFAAEAVASGRFEDVSDVIRSGVRLLREQERARAALLASVSQAREQSERDGYLSGDEVAAHVLGVIGRRVGSAG